jgi:hypothetical protein
MAVTSMLIAALNDVPDCYSDVPVVFACVRLRGLAIEDGFDGPRRALGGVLI